MTMELETVEKIDNYEDPTQPLWDEIDILMEKDRACRNIQKETKKKSENCVVEMSKKYHLIWGGLQENHIG